MADIVASKQTVQALQQIGHRYGVPLPILYGVWGMETDFGHNVATSSAGAQGDFQFIPSTAAKYNYPLTNNPSPTQWVQQAEATAHYLSDLFHQTGSWDAALKGYSGGGYGLAQVQNKSQHPGTISNALFGGIDPGQLPGVKQVGQAASAVGDAGAALGSIASMLTDIHFWIRLGEAIAGVVLLAMGLRTLSGSTTSPLTVVKAVTP